ncbi:MAG: hypothetical protein JNM31_15055 [Flavobacteriales bacterium]|nr:hypothetical protein [Flavobacteriales bacterium]
MRRSNTLEWSLLWACCIAGASVNAQTGTDAPERVTGTFGGTYVINAQSIEVVPRKRSFGFLIQHRFGAFTFDGQAAKQFLGLDLPANIRFAFLYAPRRDVHLELGRSKNGKVYDLGLKARLLKQTVGDEMPISVTAWANVALMSDDFPAVREQDFFADGVTPFAYRTAHRLSYNTQVIMARRFSSRISLQLAPVFIYQNLVPVGGSNLTVALPVSGRWRVSTKGSLLAEVAPLLVGGPLGGGLQPVAIGYEVATLGHVFQIVVASSQEIVEQRLYTLPVTAYNEGYFHLGFNIARVLFVKPKQSRP